MLVRFLFVLAIAGLLPRSAMADDVKFDFRRQMLHEGDRNDEGLMLETSFEVPISFANSRSQLGVSAGNYIDIGGTFRTSLHYRKSNHDWSTGLFLSEVFDMSPAIPDRWVKNVDILRFETRYLYNLYRYLGFFAHGRMETSIFTSIDLNDKEKVYQMRNVDDSIRQTLKASEVHLNDPFLPLFFQENFGAVSGLVQRKEVTFEVRGGVSFRQTFANNQRVFVLELDDETRVVRDLRSFYQIGPVVGAALKGTLFSDRIEYSAGIDVMWPAWQTPKTAGRTFAESLVIETSAGVGLNLSDWGSLQYQYIANRIPDILKTFQQRHSITLNLRFDWHYLFGKNEATPEPNPA